MIKSAEEQKKKTAMTSRQYSENEEQVNSGRYSTREDYFDEYLLEENKNLDIIEEETTHPDEVASSIS